MNTNQNIKKEPVWNAALRYLLGNLFIISGFVKANDFIGFSYKLEEYFYVFGLDFMAPAGKFLAWFLSVFEMSMGFAMIVGYAMPITAWLLVLLMGFFTLLTGYSAITNAVTDCGCFGDAIKLEPVESFIKDLIIDALMIPLFLYRKRTKPLINAKVAMGITVGSFIVFGYFSFHCYRHLPLIDFLPYKVGNKLSLMTVPSDANQFEPKAHDYSPFANDSICGGSEFEGNVLIICLEKIEKADYEELAAAVTLGNTLAAKGYHVFCGTSSVSTTRKAFIEKYTPSFCVVGRDEKVLKTMMRGNLGFILVRKDIIRAKWLVIDIPTPEQVDAIQ